MSDQRASRTLSKMTPGTIGGQSKTATPPAVRPVLVFDTVSTPEPDLCPPVDAGPAPTAPADGLWAPGDSTGVVLTPSTAGWSFNELHWGGGHLPLTVIASANLGSLSPGESTEILTCGNTAAEPALRFRAQRSSGAGTTVSFYWEQNNEFSAGMSGPGVTTAWLGADHIYAFGTHDHAGHDRSTTAKISVRDACGPQATSGGSGDTSGTGHILYGQLNNTPWKVPATAKADLRVHHIAVWHERYGASVPTTAQRNEYFGQTTCACVDTPYGPIFPE